eukprot:scaffold274692_cov31-Tisochrysis_lutea.AAC.4
MERGRPLMSRAASGMGALTKYPWRAPTTTAWQRRRSCDGLGGRSYHISCFQLLELERRGDSPWSVVWALARSHHTNMFDTKGTPADHTTNVGREFERERVASMAHRLQRSTRASGGW